MITSLVSPHVSFLLVPRNQSSALHIAGSYQMLTDGPSKIRGRMLPQGKPGLEQDCSGFEVNSALLAYVTLGKSVQIFLSINYLIL